MIKWTTILMDYTVRFFALIGVGLVVYWLFDRVPIVRVEMYVPTNLSIKPPGVFTYDVHFKRRAIAYTHVKRWLIDSQGFVHDLDAVDAGMSVTGLDRTTISHVSIPVPIDMPHGVSYACFEVTWRGQYNLIHWWFWPIKGPETCLSFIVNAPLYPELARDVINMFEGYGTFWPVDR